MTSPKVYPGSIAIIGGGISGATLAIAMQRRGLRATIYEQAHKFGEIGAGVAFNPAAIRAMDVCSPDVTAAFRKVQTGNVDPAKARTWFDWVDAMTDTQAGRERHMFSLENENGASAVHRAHYLDEMVRLIPEGTTRFGKHLDGIDEVPDGSGGMRLNLRFRDGSEAVHDAVIGADGIKSSVRKWMFGADNPSAHPVYTHKYAYRGLIPMDKASEALGADVAQNAKMHMGKDGHILTFAVNHGETMNVVAFKVDPNDWLDYQHLTKPSTHEHVREDFKSFGPTAQKIIDLLEPSLDCWAIFDLGEHPLPYYNKGKVLLCGDSAHATSPHHGAGAGMCIEDCAVLAELLADPRLAEGGDRSIEQAFKAHSDQRRERTQWLVQSSRRVADLYEMRSEFGDDATAIGKEVGERCDRIWNGQVQEYIAEAKELMGKAS